MVVKRIKANIQTPDPTLAKPFYGDILGLDVSMDFGWIVTYESPTATMKVEVSFASEGGNGTPLPALSIEVEDVDETLAQMRAAGFPIAYGPADEPWGVRRFFVRDPFGTLVNILGHAKSA